MTRSKLNSNNFKWHYKMIENVENIIETQKPELDISDVMKCPFCDSDKIEESMFTEEWDCYNCLRPFKKKDFL